MGTDSHDATPADDMDPSELKHALGRTGRMLKTAGLPFEPDEFEDGDDPEGEAHRRDADATANERGVSEDNSNGPDHTSHT